MLVKLLTDKGFLQYFESASTDNGHAETSHGLMCWLMYSPFNSDRHGNAQSSDSRFHKVFHPAVLNCLAAADMFAALCHTSNDARTGTMVRMYARRYAVPNDDNVAFFDSRTTRKYISKQSTHDTPNLSGVSFC